MKRFEGDNSERKHSDENRTRNVLHGIGRLEEVGRSCKQMFCFQYNVERNTDVHIHVHVHIHVITRNCVIIFRKPGTIHVHVQVLYDYNVQYTLYMYMSCT